MTFDEYPIYVDVKEAMAITGLGQRTIEDSLHNIFPLPHIKVGRLYKINKYKLRDYFEQFETQGKRR
jgi:hypothetical protein